MATPFAIRADDKDSIASSSPIDKRLRSSCAIRVTGLSSEGMLGLERAAGFVGAFFFLGGFGV